MTFEQAYQWLCGFQFHGIKPGLERITLLLERLGNPHHRFPAVHIAGTNGKGSTAAILETLLRAHGIKTGLYTSPHLVSVCERFLIGGRPISTKRFASLCTKVKEALGDLPITYFELTTAMAFVLFAEEEVDLAVVECGLGGRLDATNVLVPQVALITTVGLDHQAYLGHSLTEVAREKAGIIKPQVPVVIGPLGPEALEVVEKRCAEESAPLWRLGRDFRVFPCRGGLFYQGKHQLPRLSLRLKGKFQQINLALALKAHELLAERGFPFAEYSVREALNKVFWPGRYEKLRLPRLVILDGAHNLDGVEALLASLREDGIERYELLFAASDEGGTKPYLEMLRKLVRGATKVFLCPPPGPRRPVTIKEWEAHLRAAKEKEGSRCREIDFVLRDSWEEALSLALAAPSPPLLVTGSLYLVGHVRQYLYQKASPKDAFTSPS